MFRPDDPASASASLALATDVARAVESAGGRAYLAGGCVRDKLRGLTPHDHDLEVFRIVAEPLRAILGAIGSVDVVGKAFGIFKLRRQGAVVDVGLPRRERKVAAGHKGFEIEADPFLDVATAASRRDLTINAILEDPLTGEIVDPFDGRGDIQRKLLRHVSPAFAEDPLRVLRVVQFAARFQYTIAPETAAFCRTLDLGELPRERIADELAKWLARGERPSLGLHALVATGASVAFPELLLGHDSDHDRLLGCRLDRAAPRRDGLPDEVAFMLAAVLAPLATSARPPEAWTADRERAARGFLERAALGAARQDLALALARELETARSIAAAVEHDFAPRLRRLALRAPVEPLARLLEADAEALAEAGAGGSASVAAGVFRQRAAALGVLQSPPAPFLQGRDLLALGATPGKAVGEILAALFERQLDGEIRDEAEAREAAKALLRARGRPD